ncbi:thermosome subunit alpha [Haloplanus pelagicus]|jgi:chaperonin GroEL (HSP60 family)|uniref:thermosome subunit alpha n=1 Tax=Haloplanus pelagicus TaxID=2949995 RepID=UPI002040B1E3|nr:thermosome subunit alpha [Haloplanus sp. HW8-1]
MSQVNTIANVTDEVDGDEAVDQNISAGIALADVLRTTLGPNGRDKMLVGDGQVVLTNDGASIVDRIDIESPAAKLVSEVAHSQGGDIGDGATSAIVLSGALLREANELLEDGFHPTTIVNGYGEAATRARNRLPELATWENHDDETRRRIVETSITGRWDAERTAFLADLAVRGYQAARSTDGPRLENVTIHGIAGGGTADSKLLDGLVIDTDRSSTSVSDVPAPLPRRVEDANVAVVDDELTIQSPESTPQLSVEDTDALRRLQAFETGEYERYVDTLTTHNIDVLFCQKSIDDRLKALLAQAGILAFERTRQDEVHKLERATGASPIMRPGELNVGAVGHAHVVERRTLGASEFTLVRDSASTQVSLLLRGGTDHVVDETERIVVDAIDLLASFDARAGVVPGGGATEVALAADLRTWSRSIGDRTQIVVDAVADALETIPRTLARNAGHDPIDTLLELRHRHDDGDATAGLDVNTGDVADMYSRGIVAPVRLNERLIANATEAVTSILRIDGIIHVDEPVHEDGDDHDHQHAISGGFQSDSHGYPWAIGH